MARKNVIMLVDDLEGKAADETVRFGLDGARGTVASAKSAISATEQS